MNHETRKNASYRQSKFKNILFQLKSPFLFRNSVYCLEERRKNIQVYKFGLSDTEPGLPVSLEKVRDTILTRGDFKAVCVFRGEVFVFFDNDAGNHTYEICYKKTADPDTEKWHPEGDANGFKTGLKADYVTWGLKGAVHSLRVIEFNSKIYLFYSKNNNVHWATFDGTDWKEIGAIGPAGKPSEHKYIPIFNVTSVLHKGKQVICFAGFFQNSERDHMRISFINAEDTIEHDVAKVKLGHDQRDDDQFALAYGSRTTGPQTSVLQIFVNGRGKNLYRTHYDIDNKVFGNWTDHKIESSRKGGISDPPLNFCDTLSVSQANADNKGLRTNIVVISNGVQNISGGFYNYPIITSFPSDRLELDHEHSINMATQPYDHEVGTWTLIGVVEGVPPYSRNGHPEPERTSKVEYGQSSSIQHLFSQTVDSSVSVFAGGAIKDVVSVTGEMRTSFAVTGELSRTFSSKFAKDLTNGLENPDGTKGMAIFSIPTIRNRNYLRKPATGDNVIGTFALTQVTEVDIQDRFYDLEKPIEGMLARPKSDQLLDWGENSVRNYPDIPSVKSNSIQANAGGAPRSVALNETIKKSQKTTGVVGISFKASATILELFKIGGSTGVSIATTNSITSTFTRSITAKLELPIPNPAGEDQGLDRINVVAHWYLPPEDIELELPKKPHWIPNQYFNRHFAPWCLTWQVLYPASSPETDDRIEFADYYE